MNSSFLLVLIFTALTVNVASAQMSTMPSPKEMAPQKKASTFDSFYERLKIGWFGVVTTPHLDDIEKGQWRNAATSPQYGNAPKGEQKNHDTWPTNVWNQISFRYRFGGKMDFVFNPRFMVPLAGPRDMTAPEHRALIMLDDFFVGFQGVVYTSTDSKFNLFMRTGLRLPVSRASRNSTQGSAGAGTSQTLSNQAEVVYNVTYDFTKKWQLGIFGQFRQWVVEDQFGFDRFRIYTAPYVQYTLDDVSRVAVYYENIMETDRRSKPADDRDPVFKNKWQNIFVGYNRDYTAKFNAMPYVGVFVNDKPITDKSVWFGAWLSYTIK